MTDAEIKKALEVCAYLEACADCPFGDIEGVDKCMHSMMQNALDLINRQQAEIERLQKASEEAVSCFHRMESLYKIKCIELKVAKAEAIKEFAERLKDNFPYKNACYTFEGIEYRIDNLLKEMVGDAE